MKQSGFFIWLLPVLISLLLLLGDNSKSLGDPNLEESSFKLDKIVDGFSRPTGMSFLGPSDFLVTEEDTGKVKRVIDGRISQTVLDVDVSTNDSRGLIGIDSTNVANKTFVFLYFTESSSKDDGEPIGNRLYRYELINGQLTDQKLLLDMPAGPGSKDNGGPIVISPDNNVYSVVGHVAGDGDKGHETKAQNFKRGPDADGSSGIHRVTIDGNIVDPGILGSTESLDTYYAYGIRNTFGMDFDPITSKLWITENGVYSNDEINLVEPGFNGGWKHVTGLAPSNFDYTELVTFNGSGKYSDPEFVWNNTVSPTALLFFNSDKFGPDYKNGMFVGDYEFGRIYHFGLNSERDALLLNGSLADKIADNDSELQNNIFGEDFGVPTDLEIGPDGMLYVSSLRDGAIYRISR
ncbi:MAG: quinoprotein glucose dehydrogenase [Nitrosopumilales archaeon]|nr:MAG: quinoprotein glucose dehydrogenase [Nitrosopumilales archaeon]